MNFDMNLQAANRAMLSYKYKDYHLDDENFKRIKLYCRRRLDFAEETKDDINYFISLCIYRMETCKPRNVDEKQKHNFLKLKNAADNVVESVDKLVNEIKLNSTVECGLIFIDFEFGCYKGMRSIMLILEEISNRSKLFSSNVRDLDLSNDWPYDDLIFQLRGVLINESVDAKIYYDKLNKCYNGSLAHCLSILHDKLPPFARPSTKEAFHQRAYKLLENEPKSKDVVGSKLVKASAWLREHLINGEAEIAMTTKLASEVGITRRTLYRASKELGVITDSHGTRKVWRLPTIA